MPASTPAASDIADHTYVLVTSYRRTGEPVGTPVWIARDGERLLVTTGAESGKIKRVGHTPRVTLTPCDMRGRVAEGTVSVEATAVVDETPDTRATVEAALLAKYGNAYRLVRLGKRRVARSVSLVLTLA